MMYNIDLIFRFIIWREKIEPAEALIYSEDEYTSQLFGQASRHKSNEKLPIFFVESDLWIAIAANTSKYKTELTELIFFNQ